MLHIKQRDYSYDTSGISVCGVTYVYNRREKGTNRLQNSN